MNISKIVYNLRDTQRNLIGDMDYWSTRSINRSNRLTYWSTKNINKAYWLTRWMWWANDLELAAPSAFRWAH